MNKLIVDDGCIYELMDTENPIGRQIDIIYSELDFLWAKPNQISTSIVQTGNGIIFHDHDKKVTYEFDYAQIHELKMALEELDE